MTDPTPDRPTYYEAAAPMASLIPRFQRERMELATALTQARAALAEAEAEITRWDKHAAALAVAEAERDEARTALHQTRWALEAIHAGAETGLRHGASSSPAGGSTSVLLNIESIARHALRDTTPSEER